VLALLEFMTAWL